jgi:hypothetical protein
MLADSFMILVAGLLKDNPPRQIYSGFFSTSAYWLSQLAPYWLLDWLFAHMAQLGKLKSVVEQNQEAQKKDL